MKEHFYMQSGQAFESLQNNNIAYTNCADWAIYEDSLVREGGGLITPSKRNSGSVSLVTFRSL